MRVVDNEARIRREVERRGPLTGAELLAALSPGFTGPDPGADAFGFWRAATLSPGLEVRTVGVRYLRLDQKVEGYARLSPSILREFLTYTVVGPAGDAPSLERRAAEVEAHARAVSRAKLDLATAAVAGVVARLAGEPGALGRFCVFIAGDVVFEMAHDVPRPERSTGRMVRGSDLDLVAIVDDAASEALARRLDEEIYEQKYRHLINPSAREEIDYIVKRFGRLREQAAFDTFKKMVACKILQEGVFLHGDRELFEASKALLDDHGVTGKLSAMEAAATRARREAEERLLGTGADALGADELQLFFTADESDEFE